MRLGVLLLLVACVAPAAAQDNEPVVELPVYVVKASRDLPPPESWLHAVVPDMEVTMGNRSVMIQGFEILSNMPGKNTLLFIRELQYRQLAAALFWPALGTKRPGERPIIIVDSADSPWLSTENPVPVEWSNISQPAIQNMPAETNPLMPAFADSFASNNGMSGLPDQRPPFEDESSLTTADVVSQPVEENVPIVDGVVDTYSYQGGVCMKVRAGGQLFNERISEERLAGMTNSQLARFRMAGLTPPPPAWLQQGLRWLIESMTVSQTELVLGKQPLRIKRGGDNNLVPLRTMLSQYNPRDPSHVLTASAFVQFGLYGDGTRYAAGLVRFATESSHAPITDEMFKAAFGVTFEKMDRLLISHASSTAISRESGFRGKLPPMPEVNIADATQADIGRMQGRLLMAQGKPAQALDVMRVAFWRGERDPKLLASLGDVEEQIGDPARAHKLLDAVAAMPSPPADGVIARVRMRFKDKKAALQSGAKLADSETLALLETLVPVVGRNSDYEDLYALVADIALHSNTTCSRYFVDFLKKGRELYPQNAIIQQAFSYVDRPD